MPARSAVVGQGLGEARPGRRPWIRVRPSSPGCDGDPAGVDPAAQGVVADAEELGGFRNSVGGHAAIMPQMRRSTTALSPQMRIGLGTVRAGTAPAYPRGEAPHDAFGYTLMTEQSGPTSSSATPSRAEQAGFDFEVIERPLLPVARRAGPRAVRLAVLGAVAQATERVELMTYVTCPTMRYHPAVVAQKAATLAAARRRPVHPRPGQRREPQRARRRAGWPAVDDRHEMLDEAIEIIRELLTGELRHLRAASTSRSTPRGSGTCPSSRSPIGVAVVGRPVDRAASPRWPTT